MAYTLQAIVGKREVLEPVAKDLPTVMLEQQTVMIPLNEALRELRGIPFLPLTDEGDTVIPAPIEALCRALSTHGKVAYVEAEFFGGDVQAAVLAEGGQIVGEHQVSQTAINAALSFIGIDPGKHRDEFEAIGLGAKRDTEQW